VAVPHGTLSRYALGCRCPECRAAKSDYERKRRHELAAQEAALHVHPLPDGELAAHAHEGPADHDHGLGPLALLMAEAADVEQAGEKAGEAPAHHVHSIEGEKFGHAHSGGGQPHKHGTWAVIRTSTIRGRRRPPLARTN
jgi:hypothetical protein